MVIAESFKARKSPCITCDSKKLPSYPECRESCQEVNDYLVAIGDRPHEPKTEDLSILYPSNKLGGYMKRLCTEEEYKAAALKLCQFKRKSRWTYQMMSDSLGISEASIKSCANLRKLRMDAEYYEKVMAWQPPCLT